MKTYPKRVAVDLAKEVFQAAESVRAGEVSVRKWLSREQFRRYLSGLNEPVELIMEAVRLFTLLGKGRIDVRA